MRLYYNVSGLDTDKISQFKVYTSHTKVGVYKHIDTVKFNPLYDYIEVNNNVENYLLNWFKLSLLDYTGKESGLSDSFLSDSIGRIIESVKDNLGDTGGAFSDDEYITKIKQAIKIHFLTEDITSLKENEIGFIEMLVMISCCYDLAFDNARYTKITLPDGISLDKGERVDHYLAIAKQLQARYDSLMGRIENADGSMIHTTQLKKRNYFKRGW